MASRLERIREIVREAMRLPLAQREGAVQKACGDDTELCEECLVVLGLREQADLEGTDPPGTVTMLAGLAGEDGERWGNEFWMHVLDDMKRLAHMLLAHERRDDLPESISLVVRAWERLDKHNRYPWKNRRHFFGSAIRAMKRIIIEMIRKPVRERPADSQVLLDRLAEQAGVAPKHFPEVLEAMEKLAVIHPRAADVIWYRVILGMKVSETAVALGIGERTVKNDYQFARAWLHREISNETGFGGGVSVVKGGGDGPSGEDGAEAQRPVDESVGGGAPRTP